MSDVLFTGSLQSAGFARGMIPYESAVRVSWGQTVETIPLEGDTVPGSAAALNTVVWARRPVRRLVLRFSVATRTTLPGGGLETLASTYVLEDPAVYYDDPDYGRIRSHFPGDWEIESTLVDDKPEGGTSTVTVSCKQVGAWVEFTPTDPAEPANPEPPPEEPESPE